MIAADIASGAEVRNKGVGVEDTLQLLMTIGLLLPVAAGVGFLFFAGIRHMMKGVVKQTPPVAQDSATEIERIRAQDRAEARALYERITRDKLDVIKTAVAMGADQQELKQLDARLEELVGSDKLHALLEGRDTGAPPLKDELLDLDLSQELENLRRGREGQAE